MSEYITRLEWKGGQELALEADQKPGLTVAPPSDFGGSGLDWSPEELMGGAVDSCLLLTTLYFVKTSKIDLTSYRSSATVQMDRTAEGLRIQGITLNIEAVVGNEEDVGRMRKAIEKAEKLCPVSATVRCPVEVNLQTRTGGQ